MHGTDTKRDVAFRAGNKVPEKVSDGKWGKKATGFPLNASVCRHCVHPLIDIDCETDIYGFLNMALQDSFDTRRSRGQTKG